MSAKTVRLTMAQALIKYLTCQYTERDGEENALFAGCFGVFGHGCVSGIGQALQQYPQLRYYQTRNEQAMVHASAAYAKTKNRMQTNQRPTRHPKPMQPRTRPRTRLRTQAKTNPSLPSPDSPVHGR